MPPEKKARKQRKHEGSRSLAAPPRSRKLATSSSPSQAQADGHKERRIQVPSSTIASPTSEPIILRPPQPANWPADVHYLCDACRPSPLLPDRLTAVLCATFPPLPPGTAVIPHTDLLIKDITPTTSFLPHPLLKNTAHPALGKRGLFARRRLPARTLIAPYLGEVHTETETDDTSEYDAKVWVKADEVGDGAEGGGTGQDIGLGIDATRMGNVTRFINDFRGIAQRANVTFEEWPSFSLDNNESLHGGGFSPQPRGLALYTLERVEAGAELCVSYGKGFWEARGVLPVTTHSIPP
ncbi:hypothetical protein V8E36_001941 [Tilletia maclaganii]